MPGRRAASIPPPYQPSPGGSASATLPPGESDPALPGSLHPMRSSHQGQEISEASWYCLSLKEVRLSPCLVVFIGGSSSLTIGRFSSNDRHRRAGPDQHALGEVPCATLNLAEKGASRQWGDRCGRFHSTGARNSRRMAGRGGRDRYYNNLINEPFAKFGVGHEMGAECSCKITPSKGICTWLAMGFPGTTTLPDNKSRFLANFAKGSFDFKSLLSG